MSFDDHFARMMPQAEQWFAEQVTGKPAPEPHNGYLVPPVLAADLGEVVKLSAVIHVPDELLMADGLIPDTRPPRPPLPWRYRLRNKISDWRERAACRAFKLIAGYEVPDGDDW